MVRIVFFLAAFAAFLAPRVAAAAAGVTAEGVGPEDAFLEIEVDAAAPSPFVGEMILVTINGYYDLDVALEKFEGFDIPNVSWIQLGRDEWSKARVNGRQYRTMERKLAVYPLKPGPLTIGPFLHHLTIVKDGKRVVHDVPSGTETIEISAKPATNGGWWMPATGVEYSDVFSIDPEAIGERESVQRTISLIVHGQTAEHLPPPPKMLEGGLITFMDPEERKTIITRDGPVASVTWSWRIRPSTAEPARIGAFHIPWFDQESREMREIVIASQRFAFAAIAEAGPRGPGIWAYGPHAAILLGLALPCFALLGGRRVVAMPALGLLLSAYAPSRAFWRMRAMARRRDAAPFREAAAREMRAAGVPAGEQRRLLELLDAHLFAAQPAPRPNLSALVTEVRRACRRARLATAREVGA